MSQRSIAGFFRRKSTDILAPSPMEPSSLERTPLSALRNGRPTTASQPTIGKKRPRALEPSYRPQTVSPGGVVPSARHKVHDLGTQGDMDASQRKRHAMEKIGDGETMNEVKMKEVSDKFIWLHKNIRDAQGRKKNDLDFDPRTIQVCPNAYSKLSASQKAYWDIKSHYMDTIVFFKVGFFYELYEDDAEIASRLLGWKMTISGVGGCRQVGTAEGGVDNAIEQLRGHGYKVGRVEQLETAKEAKERRGPQATIKRALTAVLSPATTPGATDDAVHLMAVCEESHVGSTGGEWVRVGFAFMDAATDHFYVGELSDGSARHNLTTLLTQVAPAEILYPRNSLSKATAKLVAHPPLPAVLSSLTPGAEFPAPSQATEMLSSLDCFGGPDEAPAALQHAQPLSQAALAALVCHLQRLHAAHHLAGGAAMVSSYEVFSAALKLDGPTLVNLELLESSLGGPVGSLLACLDSCVTPGGRRLLRRWLCRPLTDVDAIEARLDAVAALKDDPDLARQLRDGLQRLGDVERTLGAARTAAAPPSLALPHFLLQAAQKRRLAAIAQASRAMQDAAALLCFVASEMDGTAAASAQLLREVVAAGELSAEAKDVLNLIDESIDWPDVASKGKRKGKKGGGGPSLKEDLLEHSPASAPGAASPEDARFQAEVALTNALMQPFHACGGEWEALQQAVAVLDVLHCFVYFTAFAEGPTCRPRFVPHGSGAGGGALLDLQQTWHPCTKPPSPSASMVKNDLGLGSQQSPARSLLLTGPNMGGKSTLLRASCTAVIMAQMGCYVAAEACTLSPADRIFTRLGASDNIMAGESTFLVECMETSAILRDATPASVVVLDELGRGTSSFDGYAIAWATLRHLSTHIDPRLIFATHYAMLCDEFAGSDRVRLGHMAALVDGHATSSASHDDVNDASNHDVSDNGVCGGERRAAAAKDDITFLYQLRDGACPSSYGLQVAGLAGIPKVVRCRAAEAAAGLEQKLEGSFVAASAAVEDPTIASHSVPCGSGDRLQKGPAAAEAMLLRTLSAALGRGPLGPGDMPAVMQLWQQSRSTLAV